MNILEGYKKEPWEKKSNVFLQATKDNKIELAQSILRDGMIYPLFSKKVDKEHYIVLGNHRALSLRLYKEKYGKLDKRFLCIVIPDEFFVEDSFNTCSKLITKLRKYADRLNPLLFHQVGKGFSPFSGFNSEDVFREWME